MHSKAALLYKPKAFLLHKLFFSVLKRHPILQTKSFPFEQAFCCYSQKPSFFWAKSFSFTQAFLYYPKQPFSALHLPFAPSHNLLSTKEWRCTFYLCSKSLRCNAWTSHRFKAFSPPFCAKNRFRLVPLENSAKIFFDRALNRRSQDGVPRAFYVTFCTTQKVTIRSLCREHRGSANLDSARRNGGFARTKLKPSKRELRGSANLESAHTNKTSRNAT